MKRPFLIEGYESRTLKLRGVRLTTVLQQPPRQR